MAALLIGLSLVPLTSAARPLTADQHLATGLADALTRLEVVARRSSPHPSAEKTPKARTGLEDALDALERATKYAPTAVGALDVPSIRNGLRDATSLLRSARADVGNKRYTRRPAPRSERRSR